MGFTTYGYRTESESAIDNEVPLYLSGANKQAVQRIAPGAADGGLDVYADEVIQEHAGGKIARWGYGSSLAPTWVMQLTSGGPVFTRPVYSSGLRFKPEYFYVQAGLSLAGLVPGVTDETTYIQAAINAAVAAGGGIVEFEPRRYNFSTLNVSSSLAPSAPTGAIAGVTFQGQRAQSTDGPTDWGTYLYPNVPSGNSTAAKCRSLIDCTGATYVSIRDLRIGRGDDGYGVALGTTVNPACAIMLAGSLNPSTLTGWESTAHEISNVLIDGKFTSGSIILGGSSNHQFTNVQAYNRYARVNVPGGTQGSGYALAICGFNFINPDLPGTGTQATRYMMYSAYAGQQPTDQYIGAGNNVFYNCQFWTQGGSVSPAVRLSDAVNNLFIGGAAGVASAATPVVEINDQLAPLGNSPLESDLNTFIGTVLAGGLHGVYCTSATSVKRMTLSGCDFDGIATSCIGGPNSAVQNYDGLRIEAPKISHAAPTAGLIYLNNTADAVRIYQSYLDCRGLALQSVGGIDGASQVINRGAYSSGHVNQKSAALELSTAGPRLPNGVGLLGLSVGGTPRNLVQLTAGDIAAFGDVNQGSQLIGSTVTLVTAAGGGILVTATGSVRVGLGALATSATNGDLYIPTCAGSPSGTPTAITGWCPLRFDTTGNKLWVYDGGWIATAALT